MTDNWDLNVMIQITIDNALKSYNFQKHSQDSGYDGNDLEDDDGIDEYANMITENSDGALVEEIEKKFQAPELGKSNFAVLYHIRSIQPNN